MTREHGIRLDVKSEPLGRPLSPKHCSSLSRQGVVCGIDLHGIKVLSIEPKPAFRGSYLPRVEGAAFDQGLVGPGGRPYSYLFLFF